jgi:hypothetical protein
MHAGEMLGHESGPLAALPYIEHPEGFFQKRGQAQCRPEYLSPRLAGASVYLEHTSIIAAIVLRRSRTSFKSEVQRDVLPENRVFLRRPYRSDFDRD